MKFRQVIKNSTIAGNAEQTVVLRTPESPGAKLDAAALRLKEILQARLQEEKGRRRLQHPEPVSLQWDAARRPVQATSEAVGIKEIPLGDLRHVAKWFRSLPRRQVVMLGDPGSGKSTTALILACALLGEWTQGEQVPLLLTASFWQPRSEVGIQEWMVKEILAIAPDLKREAQSFGANAALRLVQTGRIMPIIDGLDELPEELLGTAISNIEASMPDGAQFIVTCQGDVYEAAVRQAGHFLTRAVVTEIKPVTVGNASAFLGVTQKSTDSRWEPILKQIKQDPDSPVARVFRSPLMLDLARVAYRRDGTDPEEILQPKLFPDELAIEHHLLSSYLPSVYGEGTKKTRRAIRWFTFMADIMRSSGSSAFSWWQVNSLAADAVVGSLYGFIWGALTYALMGLYPAIIIFSAIGIIVFMVQTSVRKKAQILYMAYDTTMSTQASLRRNLLFACLTAVLAGAAQGLVFGAWLQASMHASAPAVWRWGGSFAFAFGLAALAGSPRGSYEISRLILAGFRRIPLRIDKFLVQAHSKGVVRRTGVVYEFRHAKLLSQLGKGKIPRKYIPESNRPWLRHLLPIVPAGIQAAIGISSLVLMINLMSPWQVNTLTYVSGDKPQLMSSAPCAVPEPNCSPKVDTWLSWRVKTDRKSYLAATSQVDLPVMGITVDLNARGCTGSRALVEISVNNVTFGSFVLESGGHRSGTLGIHPARIFKPPVTVFFDVRRLDDKSCTLQLDWLDPMLSQDYLAPGRRRFGREP